jgi:hypothetical protein
MYNNNFFKKYSTIKLGFVNLRYILPLIFILALFYSCQQNLDIEIKTNDKLLLVNGEFSNDSIIHSVRLYCSGSLITGRPQKTISGAKIYVTDKIDTFFYVENADSLGLYQTLKKCRGIVGRNYYLSISNIDVNNDGKFESYTAVGYMPVPIKIDSMKSVRDTLVNGDPGGAPAIFNYVYIKMLYNGADYLNIQINNHGEYDMNYWLGNSSRAIGVDLVKLYKINNPDSTKKEMILLYLFTNAFGAENPVSNGDTLICNCMNLMNGEYKFLTQLSSNSNYDWLTNNYYDQLKIPTNLPTNIEPFGKAVGYFFVYSISRFNKVFKE